VIPNRASGWLTRQYRDIEGHFKWYLVLLIGDGIVTAVVALTHGLLLWQQAALAGCFVLLFGWAVAVTVVSRRNSDVANVKPSTQENPSLDSIRSELARLNPYQVLAVRQLAVRGGMTGEQFADQIQEWGIPIATASHQKEIGAVFDVIDRETTLLSRGPYGVWNLRDRERIGAMLGASPPL
jgi:hypothetical protein